MYGLIYLYNFKIEKNPKKRKMEHDDLKKERLLKKKTNTVIKSN